MIDSKLIVELIELSIFNLCAMVKSDLSIFFIAFHLDLFGKIFKHTKGFFFGPEKECLGESGIVINYNRMYFVPPLLEICIGPYRSVWRNYRGLDVLPSFFSLKKDMFYLTFTQASQTLV